MTSDMIQSVDLGRLKREAVMAEVAHDRLVALARQGRQVDAARRSFLGVLVALVAPFAVRKRG